MMYQRLRAKRLNKTNAVAFAVFLLPIFVTASYAQSANGVRTLPSIISFLIEGDQSCSSAAIESSGTTLTIQADVDALAGVTKINGDLLLSPGGNGLDFSPLSDLAEVTGDFELTNNLAQTELSGFDCLETVGGSFHLGFSNAAASDLRGNPNLLTVSGFSKLRSVGVSFQISDNDNLLNVSAFDALESVGELFVIRLNPNLANVPSFSRLQTTGDFDILDNESIANIPPFSALSVIGGSKGGLAVSGNTQLVSLGGFPALTTIERDFDISSNPSLAVLPGFPRLGTIGGSLEIISNAGLVSFDGGFPALTEISNDFDVSLNTRLLDLSAFPLLASIGGSLRITQNPDLAELGGFAVLDSISEDFTIRGNISLISIAGFATLDPLDISGSSSVSNNDLLNCASPVPSFTPVNNSVNNLVDCDALNPALDYNITLDFNDADALTLAQQLAVVAAANRWQSVITADVGGGTLAAGLPSCNGQFSFNRVIDDLLIEVSVEPIDGPGGTVVSGGPIRLNTSSNLPLLGCIRIDSSDLANLQSSGLFEATVLREMGQVIGVGTLWSLFNLTGDCPPLGGGVGTTPIYFGTAAVNAFRSLSNDNSLNSIPLEDGFTNGSLNGITPLCGHWDQDALGTELMTAEVTTPNPPLSIVTIGSLEDIGYDVDFTAADPLTLP